MTTCRNSGRKVSAPNIEKPTIAPVLNATRKMLFLNRCNGTIGSVARRSTAISKREQRQRQDAERR